MITGCKNNIDRIIENQDEIIELSLNKEIICDEERDFFVLVTHNYEYTLKNEYIFKQDSADNGDVIYRLVRDSIEFAPDCTIEIDKKGSDYQNKICNYYLNVSQFIKSYDMKSLSWNKYKTMKSPLLTIYLNSGEKLIYSIDAEIPIYKDFEYYREIKRGWYLLK